MYVHVYVCTYICIYILTCLYMHISILFGECAFGGRHGYAWHRLWLQIYWMLAVIYVVGSCVVQLFVDLQ